MFKMLSTEQKEIQGEQNALPKPQILSKIFYYTCGSKKNFFYTLHTLFVSV